MKESHLFDPKNIRVLEEEARKSWQSPDEILATVKIRPSVVVVDLGCGSGFFTVPLAKKAAKVYAIDVQKEMLEVLEQKIQSHRIMNIEPLLSRADDIPLESETVDLVVSINTLHEFDNRDRTIGEMRRILKPNGTALIVDFKKQNTGFGPPVDVRVSEKQAVRLFKKHGFKLLNVKNLQYHYLLLFHKENAKAG